MAINFPINPSLGQVYTSGTDSWIWNGTSWEVQPISAPAFTNIEVSGTITGNLLGNVTGNIEGNLVGNVTGNVEGNVTGDLTGNVTGDVTGMLMGNADTATAFETPRNINGVSFDGTSDVTVTADANTLSGTQLNTSVVTSNLTTVGTLTQVQVAGDVTVNSNVVVSKLPSQTSHATNKKYVDTRSIAMSVALS